MTTTTPKAKKEAKFKPVKTIKQALACFKKIKPWAITDPKARFTVIQYNKT